MNDNNIETKKQIMMLIVLFLYKFFYYGYTIKFIFIMMHL